MKTSKLYYHCSNGGDGSVSVHLHQTEEAADKADEEMEEGWGESSAGSIELKYDAETQKILYKDYELIDGKYQKIWKELEQS